jgi:hypothetical protein
MASAESVASGNTRSEVNFVDRSQMESRDPEGDEAFVTRDITSRNPSQDQ